MKVGIDARFLTHPQPGGFKTYTESLISALAHIDSENEYILYVDRKPGIQDEIPKQENFRTKVVSGITPLVGVPWREQVALARQARIDQVDVFHAPCLTAPLNLSCPLVITVHDMIWASREYFTGKNSLSVKRRFIDWYNYLVPKHAILRASAIITVSQASKESILERLKLPSERIVVTHEAAGTAFQQIDDPVRLEAVRKKYDVPSSFILAIGAADPRKNIKSLIHAYRMLPEPLKEKHRLVIVWTHHFLAQEISRQVDDLGLTRNVQFLRQVPNNDLVLLYNAATLFVFPSRFEGFGLPLLEAMSCGVPVVAANNSSIPEIVGNAALLFDAQDVIGMSNVIQTVLTDESIMFDLRNDGLKRAAQFSWEKCGMETVTVYAQAFGMKLVG